MKDYDYIWVVEERDDDGYWVQASMHLSRREAREEAAFQRRVDLRDVRVVKYVRAE